MGHIKLAPWLFFASFLIFRILSLNWNNLTAVWCIHLERTAIHDKKTFLVINCKEGDGVGVLVDAGNMLIIREYGDMLREVTADW